MNGRHLTSEQIAAARQFVLTVEQTCGGERDDNEPVSVSFGDLVRLVAWYGAIRYDSGANGRGTLGQPAPLRVLSEVTQ